MDGSFLVILAVAAAAALASPIGGLLAVKLRPSSLLSSCCVGTAAGVLLGTFAFEMIPKAIELAALPLVALGFAAGLAAVYALDLYVNRWHMAGPDASQKDGVDKALKRKPPRGTSAGVLAGGTSAEEIIEGITIGAGAAIDPRVAVVVGLAICIDNISEAMSIGELMQKESQEHTTRRILGWTSLIGIALFSSAIVGWFLLRGLPEPLLGVLFAAGAGSMFYLTVTDLVPEAEARHYQQSAALATATGFLSIMILSEFS